MFAYLFKRILIFIPTFFIISLLIFGLSKMAPGDPVDIALKGSSGAGDGGMSSELLKGEEDYRRKAAQLGLDRPVFYFSLTSLAYPSDLYKISKMQHRELVTRLIDRYGNAQTVMAYYDNLRELELRLADVQLQAIEAKQRQNTARYHLGKLYFEYEENAIQYHLDTLTKLNQGPLAAVQAKTDSLKTSYELMLKEPNWLNLYIPTLHWHGFNNQYHTWMFGDYPWTGLDSTPYKYVDELYAKRSALNPQLDSLRKLTQPLLAEKQALDKLNENPNTWKQALTQAPYTQIFADVQTLNTDIIQAAQARLAEKLNPVLEQQTKLEKNIAELSQEISQKATELKTYAGKGLIRGDLGLSYSDGQTVSGKISRALYWTFLMNMISIFLSYLISIPLGVKSASWHLKNRKGLDNTTTALLFVLYSIPSFWLATIFVVLFTNPEYGMNWFPASGAYKMGYDKYGQEGSDITAWQYWTSVAHHLSLPIFCITYGSFAYLSRQMRGSMLGVMRQDFVRTAKAKGLAEGKVVWKHAFRNSLFPIITIFSAVFPAALSGSVAIEYIFSIPGMGDLVLKSINGRDWPVVFAVVMFGALLTMIGNFVADILYAVADPRVSYGDKK